MKQKKNHRILLYELIFYNLSHLSTTIGLWNVIFIYVLHKIFLMYIKLYYFNFSDFHLKMKAIEIYKYVLPFSEKKHEQEQGTNYQVLGKY